MTQSSSLNLVAGHVRELVKNPEITIDEETSLIGDDHVLDSLGLVELCLRLEDAAAEEGFDFDWTSDAAMSRNRSMFLTVATLASEYDRQRRENS